MSGRNIEDFLSDPEAFDALTEEDKAMLLAGGSLEGETNANTNTDDTTGESQEAGGEGETAEEGSATPAAATPEEGKEGAEPEPVVLAKDGKNTIPFSVLEAERERARQLEQELAALKQAPQPGSKEAEGQAATEEGAQATPSAELSALVAERDEALYAGDAERAHELSMKIIDIQNDLAASAALARMKAETSASKERETQEQMVAVATERAAALVEKYPFLNPDDPAANQVAIDGVVAERNRLVASGVPLADAIEKAVAKVAPMFEQKPTTTQQPAGATAKAAADAIAKAKAQVPTSLSQVPAGSAAHHDEGEAIRNKSGLSLLQAFEGKSSEEALKLMSRVI